MQPFDRNTLKSVMSEEEIAVLQELLAHRFSICDDEETARELDVRIARLVGARDAEIRGIVQKTFTEGPDVDAADEGIRPRRRDWRR